MSTPGKSANKSPEANHSAPSIHDIMVPLTGSTVDTTIGRFQMPTPGQPDCFFLNRNNFETFLTDYELTTNRAGYDNAMKVRYLHRYADKSLFNKLTMCDAYDDCD